MCATIQFHVISGFEYGNVYIMLLAHICLLYCWFRIRVDTVKIVGLLPRSKESIKKFITIYAISVSSKLSFKGGRLGSENDRAMDCGKRNHFKWTYGNV